jgi:hypothetical protein
MEVLSRNDISIRGVYPKGKKVNQPKWSNQLMTRKEIKRKQRQTKEAI